MTIVSSFVREPRLIKNKSCWISRKCVHPRIPAFSFVVSESAPNNPKIPFCQVTEGLRRAGRIYPERLVLMKTSVGAKAAFPQHPPLSVSLLSRGAWKSVSEF